MADYNKIVQVILERHGYRYYRYAKGSHSRWMHIKTKKKISLLNRLDNRHTANGILKDAGISEKI